MTNFSNFMIGRNVIWISL